jgi:tetratricopeptide (TPR) repeat protein
MPPVTLETPAPSVVVDAEHPWPGLVSYTEEGSAYFFGREQEVGELVRLVRQETLTVLFGKSGLGKSSILRAGLAPVLRASEFLPIFIRLDHSATSPSLESQVKARITSALTVEQIDADRPLADETLWGYFHRRGHDWWDAENRLLKPVLIFDQFEELLTGGHDNPSHAERTASFLTELEDLVENRVPAVLKKRFEAERGLAKQYDFERVPYRVILALREDFLADLEGLSERLRKIITNRFRLLPMSGTQAMDVVLKPGTQRVSEAAAVDIVNFVSSSERSRLHRHLTRELLANRQVEPALLSVVLQELNNHRIASGAPAITAELVGGRRATQILENFYERGLEGMDDRVRDFILDELLTTSGARNRVAEEDAHTKYGISAQVLATLIDRRILQRQTSGSLKWIELTHDTLADVVRADRAEQIKRREVAAATTREAAVRKELARTHRLIAAFGLLLLVAGSGLAFAVYKQFQLRESNRTLSEQQQVLADANRRLVAQQTALAEARDVLAGKNDELAAKSTELQSRAELEAEDIVAQTRRDLNRWTTGTGPRVVDSLQRIAALSTQFDSDLIEARRALAGVFGAEALYRYGYIGAGMNAAREALEVAEAVAKTAPAGDPEAALVLAGAQYALGKGLLEAGRYDAAEAQLARASRVAQTALTGEGSLRLDASRIRLLIESTQIDVDLERGSLTTAHTRAEKLLASLDRAPAPLEDEAALLRILALRQLSFAAEDETKQLPYLDRAAELVRRLEARSPDDLRWMRLRADLAYRRAGSMMMLGRYDETAPLLRDAKRVADAVYEVDRENRRSASLVGQVGRGLVMLHQKSGDGVKAAASVQEALRITDGASRAEPSWIGIRGLSGLLHYYAGDLARTRALAAQGADKQREEATRDAELRTSLGILQAVVRDAPGDAEELRNVAIAANAIGINLSASKDYAGALKHFELAQRSLERIPAAIRMRPKFQTTLANTKTLIGFYAYLPVQRREDAQKAYLESIRILSRAVAAVPMLTAYTDLGDTYRWLGDSYLAEGLIDRAQDAYDKSLAAFDEGLKHFSVDQGLVKGKSTMALYFASQWRRQKQLPAAVKALTVSTETAIEGLGAEPVQSELFEVLTRANTEGRELLKVADADGTAKPERPEVQTLRRLVDSTSNSSIGTRLWPAGMKRSTTTKNILEVDRAQQWQTPPLIPGAWRQLHPEEQRAEWRRLSQGGEFEKRVAAELVRVRTLPLSFYDGATLYEVESNRRLGVFTYVRVAGRPDYVLTVDGRSPAIHELNKSGSLRLDTPEQAAQYVRFFLSGLTGEYGNFRILDDETDLNLSASALASMKQSLGRLILPLVLRRTREGKWDARATIRYGANLFYTMLSIDNLTGNVSMVIDSPVAASVPLLFERFDGGTRTLTTRTWTEEVANRKQTIDRLRKEASGDTTAEQRQALCDAYLGLSWYQLHTKDFAGALQSTEQGLKIDPTYISLDTNRAHALLFLNRQKEAEQLYRQHIGRRVSDQQRWEDVIREDLDILERNGVGSPHFTRVREILAGGSQ